MIWWNSNCSGSEQQHEQAPVKRSNVVLFGCVLCLHVENPHRSHLSTGTFSCLLTHPVGDAFRGHMLPIYTGYIVHAAQNKDTLRKTRENTTDPEKSQSALQSKYRRKISSSSSSVAVKTKIKQSEIRLQVPYTPSAELRHRKDVILLSTQSTT